MRALPKVLGFLVAAGLSAPAGAQTNCPRVARALHGDNVVSMNSTEREAFKQVLAFADRESGNDPSKRLLMLGQGVAELSSVAAAARAEKDKTGKAPSDTEMFGKVRERLEAKDSWWQTTAAKRIGAQSQGEPLELAAAAGAALIGESHLLMKDGILTTTLTDRPTFASTVAIVTKEYDQPITGPWELEKLPICSGTRISPSAVLTAAHCVCALGLDVPANAGSLKVRIGNTIRTNPISGRPEHLAQANVEPGKTRCFGSVSGSCNHICEPFKRREINTALTGRDVALVFTTPFVHAAGGEIVPEWNVHSAIASDALYQRNVASGGGRLYGIGFGYNEAVSLNAGLGRKRCGQFVPDDCERLASLGLTCNSSNEKLLRADAQEVSARTDACPGDSGGPAFIMETVTPGDPKFYVAGIVSRGPGILGAQPWQQCGSAGSIYEFASHRDIVDWIQRTVRDVSNGRESVVVR
jgi:hypothetical protein